MRDSYVRIALSLPVFFAYLLLEGIAEGSRRLADIALKAAQQIAGEI
jgi:hypothetical protein